MNQSEWSSEYTLTYYNLRGLAEPVRLMFAYAKVKYEDKRVPMAGNYPRLSSNIKDGLPYGKLPILEVKDGDKSWVLSQSTGIGRFLAKRFGLYGKNEKEEAMIDEVVDAMMDFQKERYNFYNESDPVKKEVKQKEIMEYIMPKYLGRFNSLVKDNGGKYLMGDQLSYADFWMAHFVDMMCERFPDVEKQYPELFKAGKSVLGLEEVKLWISKRPQDDVVPS